MRPAPQADPFTALGLPARPGLTDDEVRAAWRRVAAATHPDRADGGDAARFAAAAAAYTTIRSGFGRSEALADLARPAGARRWRPAADGEGRRQRPAAGSVAGRWWSRVRRGRPARLVLRIAAVRPVRVGRRGDPAPCGTDLVIGEPGPGRQP